MGNTINEIGTRIKNTLLEMMQKNSINDITAKSVSDKCGISRTTLYSYYDSVYAVLQDIEDNYLENFTQKMLKAVYNSYYTNSNRAEVFADVFISGVDEDYLILRTLLGPHGDENFEAKLKRRLKELYMFNTSYNNNLKITPMQNDVLLEYRVCGKIGAMKWMANNYNHDEIKKQLEQFYDMTIRIDEFIDNFYKNS